MPCNSRRLLSGCFVRPLLRSLDSRRVGNCAWASANARYSSKASLGLGEHYFHAFRTAAHKSLVARRRVVVLVHSKHFVTTTNSTSQLSPEESDGKARSLAMRVTLWGAGANIMLAAVKCLAGHLAGSSALVADAAHSLSDLLTDIVTLVAVHYARLPPDEGHPYGHGRLEAVGSLSVAAVLVGVAGGVGWNSVCVFFDMFYGSAAMESHLAESGYGGLAIGACVISLVTKEALYQATARVGEMVGSQTLMANAWHHRSDAFSSIAALLGVAGGMAGAPLLDPVAGIVVSGLVAKAGFEIGWEVVGEVTEQADLERGTCEAVMELAKSTAGVLNFDQLRARRMGPYSLVDLRIMVDSTISVSAARQVAEHLRHRVLSSQSSVSDVIVHVTPQLESGTFKAAASMRPHTEVELEVRAVLAVHVPDILRVARVVTHYNPGQGIHLIVDIRCDDQMTVRQAAGVARHARHILDKLEGVSHVDVGLELEK